MNINTLLFAFPVFLGNIALFRVFRRRFPDDTLAATTVFWLPSVLFWTACIYREGMLYMLLGFLFYCLDRLSVHPGPRRNPAARRSFYYSIAFFLLIAYFRLAVAIILIPALLVWRWIEHPLSRRRRLTIAAAIVIVFALTLSLPALRDPILRSLTTEQASFQVLEGHSRLPLPVLDGTLAGVWRTLPSAILNGFFEPLPGSGGQPIYLAFAMELIVVWLIVLLAAIRSFLASFAVPNSPDNPDFSANPAFPSACLLFALAGMLTIGLFVPFAGTIIRYRSIYLPFLLAPALHSLRQHPAIQPLNRWLTYKLRFFI